MTTTRRLAAILAADVAGYSRLMSVDEVGTLKALKSARREVVDPAIAEHHGRIVKTTGDGMLVEFASAVDAVTCAISVQEKMAKREGIPKLAFRIGINVGDIIIEDDDIFGDGVNVAARVENECQPGGVCVSANAFEQVRNKTSFAFDDMGEKALKNIDRPIRIYVVRIATDKEPSAAAIERAEPLPLPDTPSIAVLPFQNMSGDPEQEYFADGIVEDIITALSRFKSLFVIARNSSFTYKGKAVDIKQVGRELGVRYVLEGSVRKAGGRVRITGQLIEAETGTHLWADKFDGALEHVFDLQDQVTSCIAGTIIPAVQQAEINRSKQKKADNPDAYDCYLRALAYLNKSSAEEYSRALQLCYRAIELSPDFPPPYSLAVYFYAQRSLSGFITNYEGHDGKEALRLARIAMDLAPTDPDALMRGGQALGVFGGDLQTALSLGRRALALNPNFASGWRTMGYGYLFSGQFDAAKDCFDRALRLSPFEPRMFLLCSGMALVHFFKNDYAQGYEWAERAMQERPEDQQVLIASAVIAIMLGERDE